MSPPRFDSQASLPLVSLATGPPEPEGLTIEGPSETPQSRGENIVYDN
jgi:hypothetical protein